MKTWRDELTVYDEAGAGAIVGDGQDVFVIATDGLSDPAPEDPTPDDYDAWCVRNGARPVTTIERERIIE